VKPGEGVASRASQLGLLALVVVLFLTFLDNTVVSVALGNVQTTLHAGVTNLQWVVDGYALVFASLMLAFGTIGDLFGRKRVMLIGVAVFCAGSLLAALAPNVDVLVAARAVMGVGAAASEPGTLSMLRHLYSDNRARARALGVWSAIAGLALAMGPLIGGVLVGLWSWRGIFWFNLAFGGSALVLGAFVLPESKDPVSRRFDLAGLVLGAGGVAAVVFAVMSAETSGYGQTWVKLLFVAGALALVGFLLVERKAGNPILEVRYFRRTAFAAANFVALATYFGLFSIFFFVALYLQEVGTSSGYGTAVDFVPMAAGMIIASVLSGRWVAAMGPRIPMTVGCVLAGVGIILTDILLKPTSGVGTLGFPLGLAGLGFGITMVPVTSTALASLPGAHSGMAASMTNTSRELGAVAGVTILGSIVNGQLTVNLVAKLTAIGIPKSFQQVVVTSIETGTTSSQASQYGKLGASIQKIINEVTSAAYGAFQHGLDLSLLIAGSLMLASAVVASALVRGFDGADVETIEAKAPESALDLFGSASRWHRLRAVAGYHRHDAPGVDEHVAEESDAIRAEVHDPEQT
jgi:EmrB/QacA subfamily drug resistance transporter